MNLHPAREMGEERTSHALLFEIIHQCLVGKGFLSGLCMNASCMQAWAYSAFCLSRMYFCTRNITLIRTQHACTHHTHTHIRTHTAAELGMHSMLNQAQSRGDEKPFIGTTTSYRPPPGKTTPPPGKTTPHPPGKTTPPPSDKTTPPCYLFQESPLPFI